MSGHSRWSNIKHKKAASDAKRGKAWTKAARMISMAAKKGGNPDENPALRLAVDKAKAVNMPKDTIDKAIKKGTGELEGENLEEVVYEGYGPEGVAILCKILTDNRNRTAPEIKRIFERAGGKLGTTNCVAWMFSQKGVILVSADKTGEERLMEIALEAGAEDVAASGAVLEITTRPEDFEAVRNALAAAAIEWESADVMHVAADQVRLGLEKTRRVLKLVDDLDGHDDVESVSSNLDISDDLLAQL